MCRSSLWYSLPRYSVGQKEEACLLSGFLILPSPYGMGSKEGENQAWWADTCRGEVWLQLAPVQMKGSHHQGLLNDCSSPFWKQRPFFLLFEERASCFLSSPVLYWRWQALDLAFLAHQPTRNWFLGLNYHLICVYPRQSLSTRPMYPAFYLILFLRVSPN